MFLHTPIGWHQVRKLEYDTPKQQTINMFYMCGYMFGTKKSNYDQINESDRKKMIIEEKEYLISRVHGFCTFLDRSMYGTIRLEN